MQDPQVVVARESRVYCQLRGPTIPVGSDYDFADYLYDQYGNRVSFGSLEIVQVEWDAPGLLATDTLTLSLYRSEQRDLGNLVARWSGTSDITGAWKSVQSGLHLEYFDRQQDPDEPGQVYGRLTNASGNSARTTCHVVITARRVS